MRPFVLWSRAFATATLASVTSLYGACSFDDSDLYKDWLRTMATEDFASEGEECGKCIDDKCENEFEECSKDERCSSMASCRLATDPATYQECLEDLMELEFSQGKEERKPWEGDKPVGHPSSLRFHEFVSCFNDCREQCDPGRKRWGCESNAPDTESGRVKLSVRTFFPYKYGKCVRVKSCNGQGGRDACGEEGITDEHGRVDLKIQPGARDSVFFKLTPAYDHPDCSLEKDEKKIDFPRTRFYPGYLGESPVQPIAVYVVRKGSIETGNYLLGYGDSVLEHVGQSLILPDSCVWNDVSAPRVSVSVRGKDGVSIQSCSEAKPCGCSERNEHDRPCGCPPCIWYAKNRIPGDDDEGTDGTGAGVVGLKQGRYTVKVKAERRTVSERSFRIKAGEMVVVRTWPNASTPDGSSTPSP